MHEAPRTPKNKMHVWVACAHIRLTFKGLHFGLHTYAAHAGGAGIHMGTGCMGHACHQVLQSICGDMGSRTYVQLSGDCMHSTPCLEDMHRTMHAYGTSFAHGPSFTHGPSFEGVCTCGTSAWLTCYRPGLLVCRHGCISSYPACDLGYIRRCTCIWRDHVPNCNICMFKRAYRSTMTFAACMGCIRNSRKSAMHTTVQMHAFHANFLP